MSRMWIAAGRDGKVQVLLGRAAVREKQRIRREIDGTIARAARGALDERDLADVVRLAALADRIARTG